MKTATKTKRSERAKHVPPNPADCFISKADVAVRLGKTVRTVEQWMMRGVIPFIKIGKGRRATVLFKWGDIEAHLKSNFGVGFDFDA
jgi:excisionase family DNA binding protein